MGLHLSSPKQGVSLSLGGEKQRAGPIINKSARDASTEVRKIGEEGERAGGGPLGSSEQAAGGWGWRQQCAGAAEQQK